MFLAHVMIDTIDATLEDREITLDGVRMCIPAHVFVDRMNDRTMAGELLADLPIDAAFVGSEMGVLGDRVDNDRLQRCGSDFRNVVAADFPAALDESKDGLFRRGCLIRTVLGFAAGEG